MLLTIALGPLALGVFLWLAAPGFLVPLGDQRVSLAGLPGGWLLVVLFAAMTAVAVTVAITVRSALVAAVVVVLLTGISFWLVILGPAIVLIAIGLGTA